MSRSPDFFDHGSDSTQSRYVRKHLILAARRRQHAQALALAPRFERDFLWQMRLVDAPQQLGAFAFTRIGLAKLGLDRAQLLLEKELALVLLDLHFGRLLHVIHDARARDFALEPAEDEAQPIADVELLQHVVLVGDLEVQVRRREVGKAARVGHVHPQDRRDLARNAIHQARPAFRSR